MLGFVHQPSLRAAGLGACPKFSIATGGTSHHRRYHWPCSPPLHSGPELSMSPYIG